ncbi:MAG: flagellar hook-length control protein FliK [Phycisphaerales bacterium]
MRSKTRQSSELAGDVTSHTADRASRPPGESRSDQADDGRVQSAGDVDPDVDPEVEAEARPVDESTEAKPDDDRVPSPEERNETGARDTGEDAQADSADPRAAQPEVDPTGSTGESEASGSSQPGEQPASPIVADAEPANTEAREGVVAAPKSEQRSTGHTAQQAGTDAGQPQASDAKTRENHQEQTVQSTPHRTKSESTRESEQTGPRSESASKQSSESASSVNSRTAGDPQSDDDNSDAGADRRNEAKHRGDDSQTERSQSTRGGDAPTAMPPSAEPVREADAIADEPPKTRPVQRSAEHARSQADPVATRADAAPPEAAQVQKAPMPNAADRLANNSTQAPDRSATHAIREGEAPTGKAVARGMNAVLRQGGGALTMRLSPASLGEVRIEMSMHNGRVSVQFDVGNVAAYQAIKGQMTELRQSLEQRGMTVERVETHVSPALARSAQAESNANNRGGEQTAQHGQHDRHDAAGEQSRGRADAENQGQRGEWSQHAHDELESDFEQSLRLGLDAVA